MINEILHMKINKELKIKLRFYAEQDNRNLSNLVQKILSDFVIKKETELNSTIFTAFKEKKAQDNDS